MSLSNPFPFIAAAHAEFVKETGFKITMDAYSKAFEAEWKTALDQSRKESKSSACRASASVAALIVQKRLIKCAKENNYSLSTVSLEALVNYRLGFLLINLAVNQVKNSLPDPPEEVNITL